MAKRLVDRTRNAPPFASVDEVRRWARSHHSSAFFDEPHLSYARVEDKADHSLILVALSDVSDGLKDANVLCLVLVRSSRANLRIQCSPVVLNRSREPVWPEALKRACESLAIPVKMLDRLTNSLLTDKDGESLDSQEGASRAQA